VVAPELATVVGEDDGNWENLELLDDEADADVIIELD
jgi:hypothetical protein